MILHIIFKEATRIARRVADQAASQIDLRNKEVLSKNCAPFTDCINQINNTLIDNAKDF